MTRPPIRVTVPAPSARLPKDLAVPQPEPEVVPAGFPSEHAESEEPFRTPRHPVLEELPEVPKAAEPLAKTEDRASTVPTTRPQVPTTRPEIPSIFAYPPIEDPREQIESLNRAANRLQTTISSAQEAEDNGQLEFRAREEERRQMFLGREEQRNEEARERADAIWRQLEERLVGLPPAPLPVPVPLVPAEETLEPEEERAEIESIASIPQQAAASYVDDIREMIQAAKDGFAKEREHFASQRMMFEELREAKD